MPADSLKNRIYPNANKREQVSSALVSDGRFSAGRPSYTEERGGNPHMLGKHRGVALSEDMRRRWVSLICDAADEAGMPADSEFRSAFPAYIEWGTRLALASSQPGTEPRSTRPCRAGTGARRRRTGPTSSASGKKASAPSVVGP